MEASICGGTEYTPVLCPGGLSTRVISDFELDLQDRTQYS